MFMNDLLVQMCNDIINYSGLHYIYSLFSSYHFLYFYLFIFFSLFDLFLSVVITNKKKKNYWDRRKGSHGYGLIIEN